MKKFQQQFITLMMVLFVLSITPIYAQQYTTARLKESVKKVKDTNEKEIALEMLLLDLSDFFPQEIAGNLKFSYPTVQNYKKIKVLPMVKANLIVEGANYQRAKAVADNLLKYLWLENRVQFIYFNSEFPIAAFTFPNALCVSSALVDLLDDDELQAVLSHEIGHLIVNEVYKEAVEKNNFAQRRTIELFCDGLALAIIKAKGEQPEKLMDGLKKMQRKVEKITNEAETGIEHPTMKDRQMFVADLLERFDKALGKAIKVNNK